MFRDEVLDTLTPENGFYAPQPVQIDGLGLCIYVYDDRAKRLELVVPIAADTRNGLRRLINGWRRFRHSQKQADYLLCFYAAPTISERLLDSIPARNDFQIVTLRESAQVGAR